MYMYMYMYMYMLKYMYMCISEFVLKRLPQVNMK